MMIDTKELKRVLIESKQECLGMEGRATKNEVRWLLASEIRLIESLLMFIVKSEKEEVFDMVEMKKSLVVKLVSINDIPKRHRKSEIDEKIQDAAKSVTLKTWALIDSGQMKWTHFSGKVAAMRKEGKLGDEFRARKRGDAFYLARVAD